MSGHWTSYIFEVIARSHGQNVITHILHNFDFVSIWAWINGDHWSSWSYVQTIEICIQYTNQNLFQCIIHKLDLPSHIFPLNAALTRLIDIPAGLKTFNCPFKYFHSVGACVVAIAFELDILFTIERKDFFGSSMQNQAHHSSILLLFWTVNQLPLLASRFLWLWVQCATFPMRKMIPIRKSTLQCLISEFLNILIFYSFWWICSKFQFNQSQVFAKFIILFRYNYFYIKDSMSNPARILHQQYILTDTKCRRSYNARALPFECVW